MTFDKELIVGPFDDELPSWLGWYGYLSDTLVGLKYEVEHACDDDLHELVRVEVGLARPFIYEAGGKYCPMQFFYPVTGPSERRMELPLDAFRKGRPLYFRHKSDGNVYLLTALLKTENKAQLSGNREAIYLEDLFNRYELVNEEKS